jgi:hypothetical protein
LEEARERYHITDFDIEQTTLGQVFLEMTKDQFF